MRKAIILAAALAGGVAFGGQHDSVTLALSGSLATNAANGSATLTIPLTGKILSLSAVCPTGTGASGMVSVATAANVGSSLGAGKVILPARAVSVSGAVTNFAVAQYLAEDQIVLTVTNLSTNALSPKVVLIYEK